MSEYNATIQKLEGLVTSYKGLVANLDAASDAATKAANRALVAVIASDRRGIDSIMDVFIQTGNLPLALDYISIVSQRYPQQAQPTPVAEGAGKAPQSKPYQGNLRDDLLKYVAGMRKGDSVGLRDLMGRFSQKAPVGIYKIMSAQRSLKVVKTPEGTEFKKVRSK